MAKQTVTLTTGMIVTVRPRNTDRKIEGEVVKYQACQHIANNGVVWIKAANGDQYKFFEGFDEITPAAPTLEQLAAEVAAWAEENLMYAGKIGMYADDDYHEVIIEGYIYSVSVSFEADGRIELSTVHRDRFKATDDIEAASANFRTVKTLRGVYGFLERYI